MINFKDLVGSEFEFFGVSEQNGDFFKLNKDVWESVCCECDGYRDWMEDVYRRENTELTFNEKPLARVQVEEVDRPRERTPEEGPVNIDDGWRLVDVTDGHVWLEMGTDNECDYYPRYVFWFHPKG